MSILWIRVDTYTVDPGVPEMFVTVYPTKGAARAGARRFGGIALPVESSEFKKLFKPEGFPIGGVMEFHRSGILQKESGYRAEKSRARHLENSFGVDYSTLDYEPTAKTVPCGDGNTTKIEYDAFGPKANAWFERLEKELDCFVHVE